MDLTSIAKRYARALLAEAKAQSLLEKISVELQVFVALYENQGSGFFELMNNPAFRPSERNDIVLQMCKKAKISSLLKQFLVLLVRRDRISLLPFIKNEYVKEMDESCGRVRAKITSATPINKALLEKLVFTLRIAVGKDIIPQLVHDESVLGGTKAEIGGLIFDGTLKTRLENLQKNLVSQVV